jgi:hypothetical protein
MSLSDPWYFARRQYSATSATLDRSIPRGPKDTATSSTEASHSSFWNIINDLKQAVESKTSPASGTQEVHKHIQSTEVQLYHNRQYKKKARKFSTREVKKIRSSATKSKEVQV